jgi:hypothetical protein
MTKGKETSNCVVRDDNHDWGGDPSLLSFVDDTIDIVKEADQLINNLTKKFPDLHKDEPMNWPFR